jgi:outer membrane protein TolC
MKKPRSLVAVILLLLIGVGCGNALFISEANARSWLYRNAPKSSNVVINLPLVVDRVLHENLGVLATKSRIGIAQGNLIQSTAPLFPSMRGLYYAERFDGGEIIFGKDPVDLDRVTYRPTLFGDYTLQTGGKPLFQIYAANQQLKRTRLAVDMTLQKTLLDACSAYFTWLKDRERERVAQVAVDEAENQLHYRELRLNADVGTRLEVMQTQTLVKERQTLLLSTQNDRSASGFTLLNHLNFPMEMQLRPENQSSLVPMTFWQEPPDLDVNMLYQIAEAKRPDIKALQTQIKESKAQLGAAWSDVFPNVTVSGYVRRIGPELNALEKTSQGAFSVSVDALRYMGVNTIGSIKSASSRIREAILNKERQIQEIRKSVAQALLNYRLYQDQLVLEQQKVREAEETYRLAKARFDAGVAINLEVIQAEATLIAARLSLQNAVMKYNIGQLQILYETGQLMPDVILTAYAASLQDTQPQAEAPVESPPKANQSSMPDASNLASKNSLAPINLLDP